MKHGSFTFWWMVLPFSIVILAGCDRVESDSGSGSMTAKTLEVETFRPTLEDKTIRIPGTVEAREETILSPRVSGIITELEDRVGATFKEGAVLVRMEANELEARRALSRAELEEATIEYERAKVLFSKNAISEAEWTTAVSALETGKARLAEAETQLGYLTIRAPYDGQIREVLSSRGDLAAPRNPILRLYTHEPHEFRVELPESLRPQIQFLEKVSVHLETTPDPIAGEISEISDHADPATRTYLMKLELPAGKGIQPGTFGFLEIPGKQRILTVPASSIIAQGQLDFVYERVDEKAVMRLIRTGGESATGVEIASGLSGDEELIRPTPGLRDGALVEVP